MKLVPFTDVDKFLAWLNGKATLLGAEGFKYTRGNLYPIPECIIDYSGGESKNSISFHKEIISRDQAWSDVNFIDFTLDKS